MIFNKRRVVEDLEGKTLLVKKLYVKMPVKYLAVVENTFDVSDRRPKSSDAV